MSKEKLKEYLQSISKDRVVELCLQYQFDAKIAEQQLAEKEKQIDIISRDNNSYKYNIDEQKRIIDDFAKQLKEKDNYHLRYELAGADETIANLRQQLAEKQNTINEINKEFVQTVHDWKTLCAEKDKEIEKLKTKQELTFIHSKEDYFKRCNFLEEENIKLQFAQKQLAIQELEKVKTITEWKFNSIVDVVEYIDNRIKELKGE